MRELTPSLKLGIAWMALVLAFAIHVVEEMATGFLPFYNSLVVSVRESYPAFPMPTFAFPVWLVSLCIALVALLLSSPLVFEGRRFMRPVAYMFGVAMVASAVGHIVGSFYFGTAIPGAYSAPVLLIAAIVLLVTANRGRHAAGTERS